MSNHFHILVSVPPRDGGDTAAEDASLPVLLARLEAAVGGEQMRLIRKQIQLWEHNGAQGSLARAPGKREELPGEKRRVTWGE